MYQLFPRPDRYLARCGSLCATVHEHRVGGAPGFLRGLRAVFAADVHVLRRTTSDQLNALAGRIAALSPDLLLLGGDYGDRSEDAVRLFDALAAVRPPLGSYGVIGNNDAEAWDGRLEALCGCMSNAGVKLLINNATRLEIGGGTLWIAGVDEYKHGRPDPSGLYPEAPVQGGYRILLSHYPVMPDPAPDLMLCGHTHGGQFNLLGVTPFALGFERLRPPRVHALAVSGLHDIGGMKLLVSKGIGASRLQFRAGVQPEIDLLVFE